jgi:hypothetical protein
VGTFEVPLVAFYLFPFGFFLPQICPVPTFLSCYGFYPFLSPRTHCVSIAKSMVRLTDPPTTGSIQSTSALPSNSCSARSARCERGQPRNRCLHCSFSPACLFFFFCSRCIPDDVYICDFDGNGIFRLLTSLLLQRFHSRY